MHRVGIVTEIGSKKIGTHWISVQTGQKTCYWAWPRKAPLHPGSGVLVSSRFRQSGGCTYIRKSRIVAVKYVFFEAPLFTRLLRSYLDDGEYGALQSALMREPERGDLMPGTGGFRKLRWSDRRRGKGKSGGLRVIYFVLPADRQIWLFTIYDKDEIKNLTPKQCRLLRSAIREELGARREDP